MCLCRRRYSQYWRPGSITNASICKNGGPRRVAFVVENRIGEIAEQNGRMFQATLKELCAFLGINILMGIHKLPKMRDYWSVDEGLGNTLIQKTMTRDRFLEILQNLHFADNLQKLPPKELKVLIVFGNWDPFLITYWSIFKRLFYQNHISLSMNTSVNSRERELCASTSRITQSNGASNFGFGAVPSLGICINLICIWEKSPKQSLVLVNQLFSPFARI